MVGLGSYPIVTLAEARAKCVENRRAVEQGRDLRSPTMPTVAEALEKAIETREQHWRNPRTAKAWRSSVHNHAAAIIDRRVDQVSTADILAVLNPVWTAKPELGRKLRQRLSMAFRWAVAANHITTNPAGEALSGVLPRHAGNGGHFDSLPASEVPAALGTIDASAAFWSTKAAIRMLALTATRSSEVRGMRWDEIDGNVWTIPADRTKTAKPQREGRLTTPLAFAAGSAQLSQLGPPLVGAAVASLADGCVCGLADLNYALSPNCRRVAAMYSSSVLPSRRARKSVALAPAG